MRALVLAGLLVSGSALATDNHCDINLKGDFQVEDKVISVMMKDKIQIEIDGNYNLMVDGKSVSLNTHQQTLIQDYYEGIYYAIPQAADIAGDALKLANSAVNEVFTELLGADSRAFDKLSVKLRELDIQVKQSFYADDGSLRIHSRTFNSDDVFADQWGQEFEQVIEEVITESLGSVMIALGTQILFSNGDMNSFEKKMDRFGKQLEQKMELQAKIIEHKADDLCHALKRVDVTEAKLQTSIQQLNQLDILQLDSQRYAM
ncbi:YggN family protein [Paraglaciecola aquimarina]|uniref:YggN family protein n=1 Tax=Paraglaciecola algarum TaxID=3050085 RepID=A0ABS9D313_9ALTE|nr:YggN family protein [Paraglaciecola sp. G1-23]MCF2947311.1 YggN family protein [Paraglaciecola sp. G1-23]